MIIKDVLIQNFFCYKGENRFSFDKGLNIISGRNGSGKSQFFNAFYWTFFDQIYSEDITSKKKTWISARNLAIYPQAFSGPTASSEPFTTAVEVVLEANDYSQPLPSTEDIVYIFRREVTFRQTDHGLSAVIPSELNIEYVQNGETKNINRGDHDMVLDSIFPRSIRKFMWYQGETMDTLYDFSNNNTLNNAINEISYFPKYDYMNKVVIASMKSINKKIDKVIAQQDKLSKEDKVIFNDITYLEKSIEQKEGVLTDVVEQIRTHQDEVAKIGQKLGNLDIVSKYKQERARLESDLRNAKEKIDIIEISTKERLINIWMLNGCEKLINASEEKLELVNKVIQEKQAHKNPVPMNLPGPEYVEEMLKANVCYICERSVADDPVAYEALKRRLNDFEINEKVKFLQENYTDLNRFRKKLLTDHLPNINLEIAENVRQKDLLFKERNELTRRLNNLLNDVGVEERATLESNESMAEQNVNKWKAYDSDISTKQRQQAKLEQEIVNLKTSLTDKKKIRDSVIKANDTNFVESHAAAYIALFSKTISALREKAYKTLIKELEQESNRLYALYLDNQQQGRITIGHGVQVVDIRTRIPLLDLNQGELVAQKLAVANAFLSLSERKMNRAYPLIADAPSSDLDAFNTYNLTVNIGGSFEQIIIMSKDYVQFSNDDLAKLIQDADIQHFYQIENQYIDPLGGNSRENRRSVATKIK